MPGDNYGFVVNYNNIYGNNSGFSVPIGVADNFDTYDGAFDARYNYWGTRRPAPAATGPAPATPSAAGTCSSATPASAGS